MGRTSSTLRLPHHSQTARRLGLVLVILLAVGWPAALRAQPAREAPVIQAVELEGHQAFERERILGVIRFGPGDRLWRSADELARALQDRYHSSGFVAARVSGTFEEATGTLRLMIDEGRVTSLTVQGVDERTAASVRDRLGIATGQVLQESELRQRLARLTDESQGALVPEAWPPYDIAHGPEGAAITIRLEQRRFRLAVLPGSGVNDPANRIDGFAPWAGLDITRYDARRFLHTNAYLRGGYGFSSHDVRWAAGVRQPLGPGGRLFLGYEAHDLTDSDDGFRVALFEEAPALILGAPQAAGYFRRRGHEAYAFYSARPDLQLGATFRSDDHESLHDEDASAEEARWDAAQGGLSRSLVGTVRYARGGALFATPRRRREALLLRDLYGTRLEPGNVLRAEATFEWASPSLGGDFDYRRLLAQVKGEHVASARVRLRARALGAVTGGRVPPQRQPALGGPGTLRARETQEFEGDHAALLNLEAALATRARLPGLVAFYDGGMAWGGPRSEGWRSDLGLGLEWPAQRAFFVRVDGACAVDPVGDADRCRLSGRIRLPF
jgi:hypothetical protein